MEENSQKLSRRAQVLLGAAAVIVLAVVYLSGLRGDMTDFGVCYQAGGRFLAGETLYRPSDGHLQYKYAPAAAVFYAAFSLLPWETAKVLWFLVMVVCLGAVGVVFSRLCGRRETSFMKTSGMTGLVFLKYLGREFQLGQVNLLILLLMVLMIREWSRERNTRAGIFWGLSLLFKPYAAVFLPYFILRRKWGTAAAGLGTLLAGLLLPAVGYGPAGNGAVLGEWLSSLRASTPGLLKVGDNASIFAFISKTLRPSPDTAAFLLGGLCVAVLAAFLLWLVLQNGRGGGLRPEILEAAILMMLVPMLSPLGWNYNYLYGLPAVYLIVACWKGFKPAEQALLAVNLLLIGATLREVLGRAAFRFYTENALVVPSFLFLFAMLIVLRRRRIA